MIVSKIPAIASLLLLCWMTSCEVDPQLKDPCENMLFGIPIARTGLSRERCQPVCYCKDYTPKAFRIDEIQSLKSWTLTQPFNELTANPFNDTLLAQDNAVCAVVIIDSINKLYRLTNYPNERAAKDAGAILTHYGPCGLCSTLQDLAVYLENIDLGSPVRSCAIQNIISPFDSLVACIEALGFSHPCAQIWAYNARNTQQHCGQVCLTDTTYNLSDGSLGPCLECDEKYSGPIFKAVAGRTRRNSGIASGICRSCVEVKPVVHDYPK